MKYYIKDTTLKDSPIKLFESTQHTIEYLKTAVQRKTGMNYEQYLTHLADLGHFGYDNVKCMKVCVTTLIWVY